MGVNIVWEDEGAERIEVVGDGKGYMARIVDRYGSQMPICFKWIDLYGNTIFNRLQMRPLIDEINELIKLSEQKEELNMLSAVRQLAERCSDEVHTYLRFVGD